MDQIIRGWEASSQTSYPTSVGLVGKHVNISCCVFNNINNINIRRELHIMLVVFALKETVKNAIKTKVAAADKRMIAEIWPERSWGRKRARKAA